MSRPLAFLSGGGEAERMIRARDWTGHPLGPPETWPPELRAALSLVLNSPESMILAWGPELSFFFNETYFPLLGPRLDWAMGERFDKVWADAWVQAKPIIDEAFAGRSTHFDDLPWKLGTDRGARDTWWSFSYSRVLDAYGEVAGLFIFTNETTARVLAEQGRKGDEHRNRQILDSAADYAVVATDTQGLVTRWSEGARHILGWTEQEMLGQTVDRFFTPEDRAGDRPGVEMRGALAHGRASDERWHLRQDGSRFWASGEMMPLRDAVGEHLGFTKVLRDRTRERLHQKRLEQAEERLRMAQEAGGIGTYELDIATDMVSVSPQFADIFGLRGDGLLPRGQITGLVLPEDQPLLVMNMVTDATEVLTGVEMRICRADTGELRWISRSAKVIRDADHRVVRLVGTVQDITAGKRAERLRDALVILGASLRELVDPAEMAFQAARAVGSALDVGTAGYATIDPDRETVLVERDWTAPGLPSVVGLHAFRDFGSYIDDLLRGELVAISDVRQDPRTAASVETLAKVHAAAFINMPVMEHGRLVAMLFLNAPRPREWTPEKLGFLRQAADLTRAEIERRRAEQQQHLLNEELAHRLKNMLAVVQAMATQTLRAVPDQGPVETFAQRLSALGAAHDVLLRRSWTAAPLRAAVEAVLGNLGVTGRCDLDGPAVDLGPRATTSLSLLTHELATNAVKYGALSNDTGRVAMRWLVGAEDGREHLTVEWVETGGPPAQEPTRRGFGSRLLRSGLLGMGGVEVRYLPEGLRMRMTALLSDVRQA